MWSVYILKSLKNLTYYVGCTNNLERRLVEHNSGYNTSTSNKRPWTVVYKENFDEQSKAYAREKQIKSYKGGNGFKKLIN